MNHLAIQPPLLVNNDSFTFSHPSIFSLFRSLLLGLESTLIREPRESVWLPVATAKDEKTSREVQKKASDDSILLLAPFSSRGRQMTAEAGIKTKASPTCDGVEDLFGERRVDGVAMAGDRRHASADAEVISGALGMVQEQKEKEKI